MSPARSPAWNSIRSAKTKVPVHLRAVRVVALPHQKCYRRRSLPQLKCYQSWSLPHAKFYHGRLVTEKTMETKITLSARVELAGAVRVRYRSASADTKHHILAEFVAVSGYHPKLAIRILNQDDDVPRPPATRKRTRLCDEAARQAQIVMWEASDRACGKRLKPLLGILLPSLERHKHLNLDEAIQTKVLAMAAITIDRLLRVPKAATGEKKRRRVVPAIRRRIPVRTFADWHEPPPGSMEMDLVAHCGG